jgi:hypothetical protein
VQGLNPTKYSNKQFQQGLNPTLSKDLTKASINPSQAYISSQHLINEIHTTINEADIPEEYASYTDYNVFQSEYPLDYNNDISNDNLKVENGSRNLNPVNNLEM